MVLIWSTPEWWKAVLKAEPFSEYGNPEFGIQKHNHQINLIPKYLTTPRNKLSKRANMILFQRANETWAYLFLPFWRMIFVTKSWMTMSCESKILNEFNIIYFDESNPIKSNTE